MRTFSKIYESYSEWLANQTTVSDYTKRIIRLHGQHPEATLAQLRGHAKKAEKPLSAKTPLPTPKRSWFTLNPKEKLMREKSLRVLSDVRRNQKSLTEASKDAGMKIKTVLNNTRAFNKIGGRWVAKTYDRIPRVLKINENGKITSIEVDDSRKASLIGRYHNAVKKYVETGDSSDLRKFEGKTVKDSRGRIHTLETDTKALDRINESIEEPEFYDIYTV